MNDICNKQLLHDAFIKYKLDGDKKFIDTNIIGTFNLLQTSRAHNLESDYNFKFMNYIQLEELIKKLTDDYANYLRRLITN